MEEYIVDGILSKYNRSIKNLDFCRTLNTDEYTVLFTCANPDVYEVIRARLKDIFSDICIIDIFGDFGGVNGKKQFLQNVASTAMAHCVTIGS